MRHIPGTSRGKLMRQIAALHAKMSTNYRKPGRTPLPQAKRNEILQQILALEKRLMEL